MRARHTGLAWLLAALACQSPPAGDTLALVTSDSSGATGSTSAAASSSGGSPTTGSPTTGSPTTGSPTTADLGGAPECGHDSPEALMNCVQTGRYVADLEFVAAERMPGTTHWQAVQDRCAGELESAGFVVDVVDIGGVVNVVGTLPGESDELVLLTAHYDHIGNCPGADDNASGVAGALEVARALGGAAYTRTIMIACVDREEGGRLGSTILADELAGAPVTVVFNFDMIGYASADPGSQAFPGPLAERFPGLADELVANDHRGDFLAIVTDDLAEPFALDLEARAESIGRLTGVLALTEGEKLDDDYALLAASDHASFWARGVPALQIFDTGVFRNIAYHCTGAIDTADRLDHAFTTDVLKASTAAIAAAAGLAGA